MDNILDPSILQGNMERPCPLVGALSRTLLCLEEAKVTVPLGVLDQRAPLLAAHMDNTSQDMERQVQVSAPMLLAAVPAPAHQINCRLIILTTTRTIMLELWLMTLQ